MISEMEIHIQIDNNLKFKSSLAFAKPWQIKI